VRADSGAWWGGLLLVAALAAIPSASPAQYQLEDDFLIFEVRLRNEILADALPAIQCDEHVYVPLGELCMILEFPIATDAAAGRAAGWFLAEDRSFSLDAEKREARVRGLPLPYEERGVLVEPDDVYVEIELLGRWFPLDLAVDLRNLLLRIDSREPLPLEQRLERERRRERVLRNRRLLDRPSYPTARSPYRRLGWPSLDLSLEFSHQDERDPPGRISYSDFTTFDLLGLGTEFFIDGNHNDGVREVRLVGGRADPEGHLLRQLRATEFSLGDVFNSQSPLIARSQKGRGVSVSNFPRDHPAEFDRTIIRGEGLPGWEVELYRNGALLDFQVIGSDGRYEFEDVPLLYGLNLFQQVLYGPQGQRREESQRFYVGPRLIEPGVGHYRLAVNQHREDLIQVADDLDDPDPRKGDVRVSAEYERGLHRRLSAALSLVRLPLDEGATADPHTYVGTSLRSSLGTVYAVWDAAFDVDGGWASQAALQTRALGMNLLAEYGRFRDYRSERLEDPDLLEHSARARIDGGTTFAVPFSLSLEVEHERRQSGRNDSDLRNRLSLVLPRVFLTNELEWRSSSGGPTDVPNTSWGKLLLNSHVRRIPLRGGIRYSLKPDGELQNVLLSADSPPGPHGRLTLDLEGNLEGPRRITYSLGWNRTFQHCAVAVRGSYRDDGTFAGSTSLNASLGRDPANRTWSVHGRPLAATGVTLARVRLDRDGDGVAGPTDEPIPDVSFLVNRGHRRTVRTNERGEALLTDLSSQRPVDVTLDPDSFADPFWIFQPEGYSVIPRPGAAAEVEFLVQETGELDGTVFLRRPGDVREAAGVPLELVTTNGTVIASVKSAFDGFYLFEKVPYGSYVIRVDSSWADRIIMGGTSRRNVTLDAENPVRSGLDFFLVAKRR
jgi:hypothetical protein